MIKISEAFDRSWNDIRAELPIVAGLTVVLFMAIAALAVIPFVGSFVNNPFMISYKHCLNRIRHKQQIDYSDFFWAFMDFNRFLQVVVLTIVISVLTIIFFILFFFPGIWFAVASSLYASIFVLDGGKDGIGSIKKSLALVKGHWWTVFLFCIFSMFLTVLGAMCFLIGVLVTTPIICLMFIHLTESLEKESPQIDSFASGSTGTASFQVRPE